VASSANKQESSNKKLDKAPNLANTKIEERAFELAFADTKNIQNQNGLNVVNRINNKVTNIDKVSMLELDSGFSVLVNIVDESIIEASDATPLILD